MIQKMSSHSIKEEKVYAKREYPPEFYTKSVDLVMKKAGFNNIAPTNNFGSERLDSNRMKFLQSRGSKVTQLSSKETIELIASQRRREGRKHSDTSRNIHRNALHVSKKQSNSREKKQNALRDQPKLIPVMRNENITKVLSPREKVLKVLRRFKIQFKELEQKKAVRRKESKIDTSRIDYDTRTILMEKGKRVNTEKMIGEVPGIEVGDEFQFKAELNLIGLHFGIPGGIDYMEDSKLATSIVASEGTGYDDRFERDVLIYNGQGGKLTRNDVKLIEDQKLVKGNLALANSMKEKTPVRVIRGIKRLDDQRGKHYIYDGLYLVHDYWREKGPRGNVLYKFKLCRIPSQPFVNLKM